MNKFTTAERRTLRSFARDHLLIAGFFKTDEGEEYALLRPKWHAWWGEHLTIELPIEGNDQYVAIADIGGQDERRWPADTVDGVLEALRAA